MPRQLDEKSTVEEIRQRFDADVERFSKLETAQQAAMVASHKKMLHNYGSVTIAVSLSPAVGACGMRAEWCLQQRGMSGPGLSGC